MTILGIDFGQKRIGLAISRRGIAFEYKTLEFKNQDSLLLEINQICQDEQIKKIVIGLSKTRENKIGFQAKRQLKFAKSLKNKLKIPIIFENEIFTTREAGRILNEQKIKKRKLKKFVDSKAAQLILQSYLDKSPEKEN